jgi:glycosyltransferase involved in cell wall biosynthesis
MTSILLATPYYPPSLGGVQQYVQNLARQLRSRHDYRVVVVTTASDGAERVRQDGDDGIIVHRLPAPGRVSQTPLGLGWTRAIRHIIRSEGIDLVNAHGPVPLFADAARRAAAGVPFVLTYHAGRMRKGRWLPDAACAAYERTVLAATARRADAMICASDHVVNEFPQLFAGRAAIVEPGVDLSVFAPAPLPAEPRIVFAGSLARTAGYKGLPDLLHVVARLAKEIPALTLEVVGGGSAEGEHRALADRLGIADRVTFAGQLGGEDLAAAYRRGRVFVLPTHFDNFPTVIVEAMAVGRPVVSTRVGAVPAVVADGKTGLLVDAGDIPALTGAVVSVLGDEQMAERFGSAGADAVERKLSWQRQADRTVEVFERARRRQRDTTVAVVAPYYPPKIGGVENYAANVARAVARQPSMRAVVLTTNPAGRRTTVGRDRDVPVVRLGTLLRLSNTPLNPVWPLQLRFWLRRLDVDLVNAHAPVPGLPDAAMLVAGRRPTVLTYHAGSMRKGTASTDLLITAYEKFVLPLLFARASETVAVSPASLAAWRPGVRLISPGVDPSEFTPGPRPSLRKPTILYVGRVDRSSAWKGIDVLLRAFALLEDLPAATLRIAGGGDAVADHRRTAERLGVGDRVDFAGVLRGAELVAAMQEAAVLVLPSLTSAESFGMVLIEAMACGTPVIGSAVGGIEYVVRDDATGLLTEPGDHEALAAACRKVLEDSSTADRLGAAGRREVLERYAWADLTDRYLTLFAEVAGSRRSATSARWSLRGRVRRATRETPMRRSTST